MKFGKLIIIFLCLSLFLIGDFVLAQEFIPNDTFYNKQWYLQKLNLTQVWQQEITDRNIIIAIIDSGVDISHPDLRDNIWVNQAEISGDELDNDGNGYIDDIQGWDFVTKTNDPSPQYDQNCVSRETCIKEAVFHGTFVAGIASAVGNNNLGIIGVSWQTKIMPLRVLNQNGAGNTQDVIAAIEYAVDNGADIINLSFVGDTYDKLLETALQKAYEAGLLIVAAAGNEDLQGYTVNLDIQKLYPVCHEGKNNENIIIGVGASDLNNKLTPFSNFGSSCVDLIAPGSKFWGAVVLDPNSSDFNEYYNGYYSGTSLAAPIVSGLAALIKSIKPDLTNIEISDLILNNTDNIDEVNPDFAGKLGYGLINPVKVFQSLNLDLGNGKLIKGSGSTVYYQAVNGQRYVFPDLATYFSWYDDFAEINEITDTALAALPFGGNVTIRPGAKMVKITTAPKVYAVDQGGVLRWVKNEIVAEGLYGLNWQNLIVDVSDAYFVNYKIGLPIESVLDYDPFIIKNKVISIDIDKGLMR